MTRLRYNGLSTTLGASLSSSATAVTFAAALTHSGGTNVPTITGSDYIPLSILDSTGKLSEIVYLTAYTAGATTGTITRAQEGTTGVSHASGDKVVHGPAADDLVKPRARVSTSSAQSLLTDTNTVINWDSEVYDTDGLHDNVTNNSRITLNKAGAWLIAGAVTVAAQSSGAASGRRFIFINKNGVEVARVLQSPMVSNNSYLSLTAFIGDVAVGDFVTLGAMQDCGFTLNTVPGPSFGYLSAVYLGA